MTLWSLAGLPAGLAVGSALGPAAGGHTSPVLAAGDLSVAAIVTRWPECQARTRPMVAAKSSVS